jgi:hypothetical protein
VERGATDSVEKDDRSEEEEGRELETGAKEDEEDEEDEESGKDTGRSRREGLGSIVIVRRFMSFRLLSITACEGSITGQSWSA